jgi:hypothetical protein
MDLPPAPRTATLFRIYLGLLAIAIVMCGVLANRTVARHGSSGTTADEIVLAAPRDAHAHARGPTINWGGQKR